MYTADTGETTGRHTFKLRLESHTSGLCPLAGTVMFTIYCLIVDFLERQGEFFLQVKNGTFLIEMKVLRLAAPS